MTAYRVTFAPWTPFVDPILGEDNKFHLGGVAKDVYDGMKIFIDFNYDAVSQYDNIYGAKANGTWTGMIGSMLENETDISGPYFIDEDRSLAIKFSDHVAFSQLTIVSGLISSNRDPFLILAVFSMPVWICLFVTTLAISAVACLIYQLLPAREKRTKIETYFKYLWAFHTGLIGKEFGKHKLWIHLVQIRTHNLVNPPSKGTVPNWLDDIEDGKRVFIAEMFWLKYLIGERFVKTGKCGLRVTNIELGAAYMSFAFRKELSNKSVYKSFNKGIRRFTEGSLQSRRLLTSTLYYEICTGESVPVTDPLKLEDFAGAFIIFTLGSITACILFVLEFLIYSKTRIK